ncbi:hypothetical protein U9M48_033430 [Paspalum notatum var. saurae]|uniref:ADF-H domain-containing protein n=1 Tax=Paspalum notatum var. saurae TaxID=547442 RepID=A0AAQ3X6L1_PASNO
MPAARSAHEGGDVLGQARPLLTWRHGAGLTSRFLYFACTLPLFAGLGNLAPLPVSARLPSPLRAASTVPSSPPSSRPAGCGDRTNPSTNHGMAVSDECKLKFQDLKSKRSFRFITFKIDEQTQQVVVDRLGQPGDTYDDFTASMPEKECRYAVFDFDFTTDENCQKSKIFFISWSPDTSRVRSKMLYASSKDRFKRELDGIQLELQATDPSEMSMDIVKARAL